MARFCTGCGTPLEQDARFCEACGRPVAPPAAPASSTEPAVPPAAFVPNLAIQFSGQGRKIALMAGVAVAVLAIAGGAAYFLMREPAPPSAAEVSALVSADKNRVESVTCLANFDYSANPARVATWDSGSQSWLAVLVAGGVYAEPTRETSGSSFFAQEHLNYTQTEEGKKAVRGGKLCFAAGIAVDAVKYEEPPKNAKPPRLTGVASYHYQQPAAWTTSPGARQAMPGRFGKDSFEMPVGFVLTDGKWQPLGSKEAQTVLRKQDEPQGGKRSSGPSAKATSGGMFSFLDGIFGGDPGSAIQGRWAVNEGLVSMAFEFRPKSAVILGQELAVTYHKEKDVIEVRPVEDTVSAAALKLKLVSGDELRMMDETGTSLRLTRIK